MTSMVSPKLTYIDIICWSFQGILREFCWTSPHRLSVIKTRPQNHVGAELGVRQKGNLGMYQNPELSLSFSLTLIKMEQPSCKSLVFLRYKTQKYKLKCSGKRPIAYCRWSYKGILEMNFERLGRQQRVEKQSFVQKLHCAWRVVALEADGRPFKASPCLSRTTVHKSTL